VSVHSELKIYSIITAHGFTTASLQGTSLGSSDLNQSPPTATAYFEKTNGIFRFFVLLIEVTIKSHATRLTLEYGIFQFLFEAPPSAFSRSSSSPNGAGHMAIFVFSP